MSVEISLVFKENNKGPRTEPCGTPDKTGPNPILLRLQQRAFVCSIEKNQFVSVSSHSLLVSSSCGGVSNAFSKSKMKVSICPPLSKILTQSFITAWTSCPRSGIAHLHVWTSVNRMRICEKCEHLRMGCALVHMWTGCKDSKFMYPAAGHIMTGNLKIISDSRIRYIVSKGPKYRFPSRINFKKCREEIASALNDFGNRWCKREYVEPDALKEWKVSIFKIVDQRIKFYSQNTNLLPPKPKSTFRHLKQGIQDFHRKYVLVPADKAANNVVVVWRLHYINTLKQELSGTKAYKETSEEEKSVVNGHCNHLALKFSVCVKERQDRLPTMYWLPKLHKTPYKARFIANSSSCTTTELSKLLTSCLTAVKNHVIRYCEKVYERSGKNLFWSIKNSGEVLNKLMSRGFRATSLSTYDFSTL